MGKAGYSLNGKIGHSKAFALNIFHVIKSIFNKHSHSCMAFN